MSNPGGRCVNNFGSDTASATSIGTHLCAAPNRSNSHTTVITALAVPLERNRGALVVVCPRDGSGSLTRCRRNPDSASTLGVFQSKPVAEQYDKYIAIRPA